MVVSVGIDVSKDKHDCFILNSEGEIGSSNFVVVRVILNGHSWYPLFPDLTSPIHE